ncbi:MAG: hypothetical protein O7D32_00190, partial [bacterium]|nr:hypothetical protein [bacterium]
RASRMTNLGDIERVRQVLSELERAEQPMVKELSRQPGRSTTRFVQLLGGDVQPEDAPASVAEIVHSTAPSESGNEAFEARLAGLESEVQSLRAELNALRNRMQAPQQSPGA